MYMTIILVISGMGLCFVSGGLVGNGGTDVFWGILLFLLGVFTIYVGGK